MCTELWLRGDPLSRLDERVNTGIIRTKAEVGKCLCGSLNAATHAESQTQREPVTPAQWGGEQSHVEPLEASVRLI